MTDQTGDVLADTPPLTAEQFNAAVRDGDRPATLADVLAQPLRSTARPAATS